MPYLDKGRRILNGDATPDMARSWRVSVPTFQVVAHESAAFGENLIHMPVSLFHHVEYTVNVTPRYSLVEQVAHRVNEYLTGAAPTKRLYQTFLAQRKLDFTQNPGKVMDDITFVRSHWWLVSEGFSLSTANSDVQKLPATLYHRIADSLAYAA